MDCFNWTELYILEIDTRPSDHINDTTLHKFKIGYAKVHTYLISVACLLGILSNLINVIVLSRPRMQSSLNLMLMSLASADMIKLSAEYVTVVHDYSKAEIECMSKEWLSFLTVNTHLFDIVQTCSILFTVLVAAVRFVFVCCLKWRTEPLSMRRAGTIIIGVVVWSLLCHIPVYMEYRVKRRENSSRDCYDWAKTDFALAYPKLTDDRYIYIVNSFIPCLLLTYFSMRIIFSIQKSARRHRRISLRNKYVSTQSNRTTMMLVFITLGAAVTEMPIALTSVVSFFTKAICELKYLQKVVDLLRAINSGVNIFFYIHMSHHFYSTFNELFSWSKVTHRFKKSGYTSTQRTTVI